MTKTKHAAITVAIILGLTFTVHAVPVFINSGNPVLPFPQFLDYTAGASLASHIPDGLSHAEMEKWIRDAYQIMMNRAVYAGGTICGVQGIRFESSPLCTEGHGYALLAAALMADKTTFDGLWFYLNDNCWFNLVPRYSNGAVCSAGYRYGYHAPGWNGPGADAATDGDVDIALAALIAWKQWGDNTGYTRWDGQPIRYRDMALDMMRFLVEKAEGTLDGDGRWTSGDIGYDGYFKGGNTWGELTTWAQTAYPVGDRPEFGGPQANSWFDYGAAGYFRCFGQTLSSVGDPAWNVNQFARAAESTNWLFGQLAASSHRVITAGQYSVNGATATFATANPGGEDFRAPFRNVMDYLWNGNPTQSWNPTTHAIVAGGNTWMYNAAIKQANFLRNPQAQGVAPKSYGSAPIRFQGVAALTEYNLDGSEFWSFHLNRFGASAAAIVASQDFDLMGQFFRELMIEWDVQTPGDNYLTSVPQYFHGFFRLIGLLTLTGNWPSPCSIAPTANMKVYKSINKTYGFPGDTVTFWINYRNYGSLTANNVYVRDTLATAFSFVSSTPAPSSSNATTGVYEWGPFNVAGLQNNNLPPTMGGITLVVRVKDTAAQGRYCNFADIRASNGSGWRSSEFPNEISTIMKRNCIDIVAAALTITKTASASTVSTGQTITYTIDYCNSAQAGWINGGRSGVNWAGGVNPLQTNSSEYKLDFAAHHEAAEPVIDWANYRISYFVNSDLHGAQWGIAKNSSSPFDANITMTTEDFVACMPVACTDGTGKSWNQRLMLRFNSMPSAPTHHLYNYYGMMSRIHLGTVQAPFYFEVRLYDSTYMNPQNWTDDWSQLTTAYNVSGPDKMMFPISPDWTKGDGTSVVVDRVNKHAYETTTTRITNILVEEWDGSVWRRVFGNGPMPGREVNGVVITDSLPACLNFGGFISSTPAGTWNSGTRTLQWNVGNMQINQCGQVKYWVTAASCPCTARNIAWIQGTNEAPVADDATVNVTCSGVSPTYTPSRTPTTVITSTFTLTGTPTFTSTASPTSTRTATPSPTNTPSPSPTSTSTATPTYTLTPTPTSSPTHTRTATPTFTRTASPTFTATSPNSPTFTSTRTPTFTVTPTPTFSQSPSPTMTSTPTRTATASWTLSHTLTVTYTISSNTPTVTPTFTMTSTATPTLTATNTYTNTASPTFTRTATASWTLSHTLTVTNTISSNTPTDTPTYTATPTNTPSYTSTLTATPTFTASPTGTNTATPTSTRTATQTVTETSVNTVTNSPTETRTYTDTPTASATRTFTPTYTATHTPTDTPTFTATRTATNTYTRTQTPTSTPTYTPTFTITPTWTITLTPLPSPVLIDISLEARGPINPRVGDNITFTIIISNYSTAPVSGIKVWDTLPLQVRYLNTTFTDAPAQISGNYVMWDISYKEDKDGNPVPFILHPGQTETITFEVEIIGASAEKDPVVNTAVADYTDHYYFPGSPNGDRHPPVYSDAVFFPRGRIGVFPNPFNPGIDGTVKFDNIVPGSSISIYTLSGEHVKTIESNLIRAYWDGKNRYGAVVSSGVYFFTVKNANSAKIIRGKIFVVK